MADTPQTEPSVADRIRAIVAENLEIPLDDVHDKLVFAEHGVDSLGSSDLITHVELAFKTQLDDHADIPTIHTVADLILCIEKKVVGRALRAAKRVQS